MLKGRKKALKAFLVIYISHPVSCCQTAALHSHDADHNPSYLYITAPPSKEVTGVPRPTPRPLVSDLATTVFSSGGVREWRGPVSWRGLYLAVRRAFWGVRRRFWRERLVLGCQEPGSHRRHHGGEHSEENCGREDCLQRHS